MGSCYSGDHIAEAHIHMDIKTCNIEEQQMYRLGRVSDRLLGELNMFYWIQNLALKLLQRLKTFGPHEGFLTHQ